MLPYLPATYLQKVTSVRFPLIFMFPYHSKFSSQHLFQLNCYSLRDRIVLFSIFITMSRVPIKICPPKHTLSVVNLWHYLDYWSLLITETPDTRNITAYCSNITTYCSNSFGILLLTAIIFPLWLCAICYVCMGYEFTCQNSYCHKSRSYVQEQVEAFWRINTLINQWKIVNQVEILNEIIWKYTVFAHCSIFYLAINCNHQNDKSCTKIINNGQFIKWSLNLLAQKSNSITPQYHLLFLLQTNNKRLINCDCTHKHQWRDNCFSLILCQQQIWNRTNKNSYMDSESCKSLI